MERTVLYLIDGSSYIFRAYHAIRALSTSKGFPTNAVYGFTNMIFRFLKDYSPKYLGIVFDPKGETFRNEIYPLYKANRAEPPDELKLQFPKIFEIVEALDIPKFQLEGYEADDLIGTIAKEAEEKGIDVVLITGDKDFNQLVSEKITLIDTMKNKITKVKDVIEKYGVPPDCLIDIFALSGDTIDNIPGARGIGEKTAKDLIGRFGSLNELFENIDKLSTRQKELIEKNRENVLLSKKLVKIKTDAPIKFNIEDFKFGGYNDKELKKIFDELEFKSLIRDLGEVTEGELEEKVNKGSKSTISYDNYSLIISEDELGRAIERIRETGELSLDLETTSKEPMRAKIVGISVSPAPHQAYYIPVAHKTILGGPKQLKLNDVLQRLKNIIEDDMIKKVGQNLKYDYIVLERCGLRLRGIYCDTMIAAHLLDSSRINYSLDELSKYYLGHTTITYKDVTGTGKGKLNFEDVDIDKAKIYACEDADVAMILCKRLIASLDEFDLMDGFRRVHLRLIDVLSRMEITGVKVESSHLAKMSRGFQKDLDLIAEEIFSQVGFRFNLNSPLQLREVLFEKLNLPKKKLTRSGEPSTDVDVLSDLSQFHPVPVKLLEYRALSKLMTTYVDALPRLINPETGRLHTSFNQVGTSTGRISSSDPNLQNIPIKTEEGKRIREAFVPEEGYSILSADYSQIELRLLAHFSGDGSLIEAFKSGSDIHNRTASEIFGVSEELITPEMRRLAKSINFGIIYGISPYGLSKQLGTSVSIARNYMDEYFRRYGRVKEYMEESIREAQDKGYASTILGRHRSIPELASNDRAMRGFGERTALNTPIQGSAADIIEIAMIRIHDKLNNGFKSKMILQVHDELLFEVYDGEIEIVSRIVKEEMEGAWELRVPLCVEIGVGENWAEAH